MTSRIMAPLFRPLMRTRAAVFMLHRFRMPDAGVEGHDPVAVRQALALLRRERYDFVPLAALYDDLLHGRTHRRPTVAFTIDDGYADQAQVGAPIFAEFDCPVTTFVTSGFLDRALWFWWDRIEHVFRTTTRRVIEVPLGDTMLSYTLGDARGAAQADFTARCKEVPDAVKHAGIDALATAAEVELPTEAPVRYAPMTWDDLRAVERRGMSFGPHTVTHPILSRTSDVQSRHEITESWRRVREEAAKPVAVFCYPNGRRSDFGDREIGTMRELGFLGAVVGETGYAERLDMGDGTDPYRVRRFAFTGDDRELLQVVSGVEVVNQLLRGG